MPRSIEIERSLAQLQRHLPAFLASRGVEVNHKGYWKCFAHSESEASCHYLPGSEDTRWFCLGCQASGDILDAAHHTDGLAVAGKAWMEAFRALCGEFNVEVPEAGGELTEEEQREAESYQAYEAAYRIVIESKQSEMVAGRISGYGWSPRTLRLFGIGTVASSDRFVKALVKQGYSKDFLTEIGLVDSRMFRPECLIYTVKNLEGRPVAFAARYLDYEEQERKLEVLKKGFGKESGEYLAARAKALPKYVNSREHALYKKSGLLFGLHAAARSSRTLYVFEGNSDCVTASDRGLVNCVAACGNAFSEAHFELAVKQGFKRFVFAMDGDSGGLEGTRRTVALASKYLANKPEIRAEILELPADNGKMDPDLYIREKGLAALRKLPARSYQYWAWRERMAGEDALEVAHEACLQIVRQPDPLLRWDMLANLQAVVDLPLEVLWETVVRLARGKTTAIARDIVAAAPMMALMREERELARKAVEEARAAEVTELDEDGKQRHLAAVELLPMMPEREAVEAPAAPSAQEQSKEAAGEWS